MAKKFGTSKQREHIEKVKQRTINVERAKLEARSVPTRSWWLGKSRDEFTEAAKDETTRMKHSAFGGVNALVN